MVSLLLAFPFLYICISFSLHAFLIPFFPPFSFRHTLHLSLSSSHSLQIFPLLLTFYLFLTFPSFFSLHFLFPLFLNLLPFSYWCHLLLSFSFKFSLLSFLSSIPFCLSFSFFPSMFLRSLFFSLLPAKSSCLFFITSVWFFVPCFYFFFFSSTYSFRLSLLLLSLFFCLHLFLPCFRHLVICIYPASFHSF